MRVFLLCTLMVFTAQGHGEETTHQISIVCRYLFLDVPSIQDSPDFRIESSSLEFRVNGQWVPWRVKSEVLSMHQIRSAEGTYLLGIPSLILKSEKVDVSSISRDNQIVEGCALGDITYVVKQDLVDAKDDRLEGLGVSPKLTFYERGGDQFIKIGSFVLSQNPFHQMLISVIGFSRSLLAVCMGSSRFDTENLLIFVDVATGKPVGWFDFSEISYSWKTNSINIVSGVPSSDMRELLSRFRKTPHSLKWGDDTLGGARDSTMFMEVKSRH